MIVLKDLEGIGDVLFADIKVYEDIKEFFLKRGIDLK